MKVSSIQTADVLLPDVLLIEPPAYQDERGFFCESFNQARWREATGLDVQFVQDNHSHSKRGVLRGIHYQLSPHAQGKLVRVLQGRIFTVAVDLRRSSSTFGKSVNIILAGQQQLWIPPGFGHGFLVLSETADCLYKTTTYYAPTAERSIRWDDPELAIVWPLAELDLTAPSLSERDKQAQSVRHADLFE